MTPKDHSIETNGQPPAPPLVTIPSSPSELPVDPSPSPPPPDYHTFVHHENEGEDLFDERTLFLAEPGELTFPLDDLLKLEEQITRLRWTVPVLATGELIKCLRAAIRLAAQKLDMKNEACQRFIRDSVVSSFTKICCDDAVNAWKLDIQSCIYKNSVMLIRLCVLKLADDCFPLLEALSFLMNPNGRFHQTNYNYASLYHPLKESEPFASTHEFRPPQRNWLLDFINKFGDLGGFDRLLARFLSSEQKLSMAVIVALLKPWGFCYEYLSQATVKKYFAPILELVPEFLDQLKEADLKFENKGESKNDTLSSVIKWLRHLAQRLPDGDQTCRNLDNFRLKMILRLLQTNSFNGKMHALNELNKLLNNVNSNFYRSSISRAEDIDGLTSEKCTRWIQENQVLDIVLRDCLHQPQYVEKLERLLRFLLKEQSLSRADLDKIWAAASGKHEAIEKNVHDLLAKLAWDFSPEQLEQLFQCFRESWTKASKKQREKLLELIRRLAEDDKEGITANKILELLWTIAYDDQLPNEITDQALTAHLKILDCSFLLDKEKIKLAWIERIMDEVKNDRHVILSLRHLREICTQFSEHVYSHSMSRGLGPQNRLSVIDTLEKKHRLTRIVTDNLCHYMDTVRREREETKKILPPDEYYPDGRFNHHEQINERLIFLKFILREGRLPLTGELSKSIWKSLAEQAVYPNDRQQCFRWFADTVEEVAFEHQAEQDFFQNHLMKLDPHLLTDLGMNCFDRLFKSVNADLKKFEHKRRSLRLVNNEDLVGIEYLWKLIVNGSDDVSYRGIQLIKEIYTNLSPPSKQEGKRIHESFIADCYQRLKDVYQSIPGPGKNSEAKLNMLMRILIVLLAYVAECDSAYHKERMFLPMARAFRGRPVLIFARVNTGQNRSIEDLEHPCHSNETWGQVRRWINHRYRSTYGVMEMSRNNELICPIDDTKTLGSTDERDRIPITVRWAQAPIRDGSSGESSSSDSELHHQPAVSSHPAESNAEQALPSVILSQRHDYCQFLLEICDLGCREKNTRLRDTARQILDLIPLDHQVTSTLNHCFVSTTDTGEQLSSEESCQRLQDFLFPPSPSQMLYNLKGALINLIPGNGSPSTSTEALHVRFLHSGGLTCVLNVLTQTALTESCDSYTRKSIFLSTLYILKRFLVILAHYQMKLPNCPPVLQTSLEQLLNADSPLVVGVEQRIGALLVQHMQTYPIPKHSFLQYNHLIELIRLIWCLARHHRQSSFEQKLKTSFEEIHQTFRETHGQVNDDYYEETDESQLACREGLELFCLAIALVPSSVEQLLAEAFFGSFLLDLLLFCHSHIIRRTVSDQVFFLTSRCAQGQSEALLKYLIGHQCQLINEQSKDFQLYSIQSNEFFSLLCRLLSFAYMQHICPLDVDRQLEDEIRWLKEVTLPVDDQLLRGHLTLAKELLQFQSNERKRYYGIEQQFISQLIEQYLFPASMLLFQIYAQQRSPDTELELLREPPAPICQTPVATSAAFDLLVVLGTGCLENLQLIDRYISNLFHTVPDSSLSEWDFSLPVGPRPSRGFVGLKNAGATCYMNSVLQQLFMIEPLRAALLSVTIPAEHGGEEEIDEDEVRRETTSDPVLPPPPPSTSLQRSEYNIQILRHIQRIFGNLLESKLQFYAPRGFWKIFKFGGEAVNLRDQHDAVEFLNTVVDCIDEALKALHLPQICSKVLGGKFADQKICKDCPHRYSREEDFTLLSVDIRHSQNLKESLEQYVIGELLDGPNAYFCEKCNKKVDTVKRTCFKKLPPVLAIQLKRFDYDWEREMPIKFNDYFEFPRELDMEPYTVQGLAKADGTPVIDEDHSPTPSSTENTLYKLVGIIVHMGQANGGHYYSFVQHNDDTDPFDYSHWYKFDDTDVSDSRMDDEEELRSQCFGGDHSPTSFDPPTMKRQRRWWNAYILFYEKITEDPSGLVDDLAPLQIYDQQQRMPLAVQRSVRKQNIKFLHNRIHFSPEYFLFMKKLVQNNVQLLSKSPGQAAENSELLLTIMQITTKFLFSIGWRTKKNLRGPAPEWVDVVVFCLRHSAKAREYLADELLVKHKNRFQEYMIDCTSPEVRAAFGRILVGLAVNSRNDGEEGVESVEDSVLRRAIALGRRESSDPVKLPAQYFLFFIHYAAAGRFESEQLIRWNVPQLLSAIFCDDGLTPASARYGEGEKLSVILSILIRCFDVSSLCKAREPEESPLPNPFYTYDNLPVCSIPAELSEILYKRPSFLKKLLDEISGEDSQRLLRFLLWENPEMSLTVLNEIVAYLSLNYAFDLRTHVDVIYIVLTLEDSWQETRLSYLCRGLSTFVSTERPESVQSLFDIFMKVKSTYPKRVYQFIKLLVQLFSNCPIAYQYLKNQTDFKTRWISTIQWLQDQLERSYQPVSSNFAHYPGPSVFPSNDQTQGYFLERTASAKSLLETAIRLSTDGEIDDGGSESDEMLEDEAMETVPLNLRSNSPVEAPHSSRA